MRIAFFGSPEFVIPILTYLHQRFGLALVVSQPDKRVGRKQDFAPTPVKQYAITNILAVASPENLSGFKMENIDVAVVAAYGIIIPKEVLVQPKFGFINIHYSLLPKYRGASPVQSAIVNGEKVTGTTIMQMDEELDHGNIILQQEVPILLQDTTEILLNKLNEASLPLLDRTLRAIEETGKFPPTTQQDHSKATFTRRLTKEDGFIAFDHVKNVLMGNPSMDIHNIIRGYYPWPGAWTTLPNWKRLKLISSEIAENKMVFKEVQLEGKQKTSDLSFLKEFLV
jgi:methionyl-tRNA formyltransferase